MTKSMKENHRSFKVLSSSFGPLAGGRYISEGPMEAGRKAGRILFKKADKSRSSSRDNHIVHIEMVEITRGGKMAHSKDRYFYEVERTLIPAAQRQTIPFRKKDGTTVNVTPMYTYGIRAVTKDEFRGDHYGGSAY
jgi:hypothetical protein